MSESTWHQEHKDTKIRASGRCNQCGEWWPCTQNDLASERDEAQAALATAQQRIAELLAQAESQAYELFTVTADNGRLQGTINDQVSVLEDQNKIIAQKDCEIASLSYDGTHINWYQRCITTEKTLRLAQNDLAAAQQQVRDLRAALEEAYPWIDSHPSHDHSQFVFACGPCQVEIAIRTALAATEDAQ